MRILFLSAWYPLPADNGVRMRKLAILRQLARFHQIDLLAFAPEAPDEAAQHELSRICHNVSIVPETPFPYHRVGMLRGLLSTQPRSLVANYSQHMAEQTRQLASSGSYDLVIASELHMAPYALLVPNVPRLLEEVELATIHDQYRAQHGWRSRLRYGLTWWKTRRYLANVLRQFRAATVVSEQELALLRDLAATQTQLAVVPNGVDAAVQVNGEPEPNTLIYPGALSYDANFDAVAFFLEAIWPRIQAVRPAARLRITGRTTPEQIAALPTHAGVEFTGYLDDVQTAIANAWAVVVPLRKGGGTRLKVLEALAIGTPVIATSKGVEGLAVMHDRDVLIADTPEAFVAQTLRLFDDAELRARLVAAGRRLVREQYDWSITTRPLLELVSGAMYEQHNAGHIDRARELEHP